MSVLLWLLARPKVVAAVLVAALLLYTAHWLYAAGEDRADLRQQRDTAKAVDGALKGAADANKDINTRPVDDLMRDKGWVRGSD